MAAAVIMGTETEVQIIIITIPTTITTQTISAMPRKEATSPVAMRVSTTTNIGGKKFDKLYNHRVDSIYLNKDIISCDLKAIKFAPWQISNKKKKGFLLSLA